MADKEKYMIKVEGKLVEVTPEVYYTYFRMERQERGQEEKKAYNQVMSYDALDKKVARYFFVDHLCQINMYICTLWFLPHNSTLCHIYYLVKNG